VHLAQSSVSDQLQSLEAELDARLFTRTRQGLRLTAAGEALAAHAQEILARVDEARPRWRQRPAGRPAPSRWAPWRR